MAQVYAEGFLATLVPGRPLTTEQRALVREIAKKRQAL
jgi:hypothetical protein